MRTQSCENINLRDFTAVQREHQSTIITAVGKRRRPPLSSQRHSTGSVSLGDKTLNGCGNRLYPKCVRQSSQRTLQHKQAGLDYRLLVSCPSVVGTGFSYSFPFPCGPDNIYIIAVTTSRRKWRRGLCQNELCLAGPEA